MRSGTSLIFALGLIGFVVLARGANTIDGIEPGCGQYNMPACTRDYEPVCGTDGETYSNECMLCLFNSETKAHILIRRKGAC